MTKSKTSESALVKAVTALEEGLVRWEALSIEALGVEPSSDKTLGRAKRMLEECAECETDMARELHAFVTAMQAVQERQRVCMERTVEVAQKIQGRVANRQELLERFGKLGERAGEINTPVAVVLEAIGRSAPPSELLAPLEAVATQTQAVADDAETLAKDARAANWDDIAREADSLRQQVHAVKKKVYDARDSVARRSPS
jgi:hypothetical protein